MVVETLMLPIDLLDWKVSSPAWHYLLLCHGKGEKLRAL